MVQLNFDSTRHQALDFELPPEGWYDVAMDDSQSAPTKDGNPAHLRLNLRFNILAGPMQGRKLFTGLNIRHTNVQTMEIANRELTSICQACNLPYVQDTQQLHGIPIKVRVRHRKDPTGVYDDQAEIRAYKPANYVPPGAGMVAPGQPTTQPQAQPNGGWQQPAQAQPQPQAQPQGWQQPQQGQPWGQPQQPAQSQQTQPNPAQPAPQQSQPAGFAAPPPMQPQQPQPQQPQNPAPHPTQNAQPPWARQ
jgi:Protein of unknown function (DUF669)